MINATVPYKFYLNVPVSVIDLYDPKRMITGNPYIVTQFTAGVDPGGSGQQVPMYELWPSPSSDMTMQVTWQKRGSSLFTLSDEELPNAIPDDLLMQKVRQRCYEWASANQGRFPQLKGVNWIQMSRDAYAEYKLDVAKQIKQDRETFGTAAVIPNNIGFYPWPMFDASYAQISSFGPDMYYGSASLWP